MRIGVKLGLGFFIVFLAMLLINVFSVSTLRKIHKEYDLLQEDIVPGALAMLEMEVTANRICAAARDARV